MKRKFKSVSILALLCFFTLSASIFAQNGTKKFNSAKLQSGGDLLVTVVGAVNFTGDGYYSMDDTATVEILPYNCTIFSHWADADGNVVSEENPLKVAVTSDTTLYAVVEEAVATLVVKGANVGGYIATDTLLCIFEDDAPKVEAVAFEGYVFSHWSNNDGDIVSTDNPYYVNTADFEESRIELGANFTELQSGGDLLVTVVGADHFTGDGYYSDGDIATVEVINFNCTWFSHWADADGNVISEENPITFTVTGDTTLYAVMEDAPATLVVQGANIGGYIATDTLICIWDEDDTPKVEAVAFEDYAFSHWSGVNGDTVSTDNPYYVNTADFAESRIELSANFTKLRDIAENLISKLNVSPNPTAADFTISFELINANNMHIVLTDLIGRDIAEVYNGFTNAGIFTKTFSIGTLPTGVYYLKISQNGKNIGTEKIIKK